MQRVFNIIVSYLRLYANIRIKHVLFYFFSNLPLFISTVYF